MNPVKVGTTIGKLRRKMGLTQAQLAGRLNVSDKAVSKWETGLGYPEITILPALSETFGVTVDYLLKGDTEGIAVAGNILVDIVNMIDRYPEKNMLANITETVHAVGGCVPNTIIDLAKIDSELFLTAFGRVGNDENGRYVLGEMRKHGIDVSGVKVDDGAATATSNVMTERDTGDRTFFYSGGASRKFDIGDIDVSRLDCRMFHAGYVLLLDTLDAPDPEYGTGMARLLAKVSERGIKTSIDVVSEEGNRFREKIIPALRHCDYVILNEIESCRVTGLKPRKENGRVDVDNIRRTMEAFMEYGVREKVIVHCCEAGFLLDKAGSFDLVPSLCLPQSYIKGSVGAGDSFAAACLYGLYKGMDDRRILEFASAAAACNLSASDSISGMRPKAEIEQLESLFERRGEV